MIGRISGYVVQIYDVSVLLSCGDIAYELLVPGSVVNAYKKEKVIENKKITFYTIQYIEGGMNQSTQYIRLLGFTREIERDFFQIYSNVSGIGYKTALKSLTLQIHKIALAIESSNVDVLKSLPHIGVRMANKIIASLSGKMKKFCLDQSDVPLQQAVITNTDIEVESIQVLNQLGYSDSEAKKMVKQILSTHKNLKSSGDLLTEIFRSKGIK